jgi:DNA-binding LytR/AlgR family response regulator
MRELNCLIVEDEPLAAEVISDYIRQVPGLALKGICGDASAALQVLRADKTDVIFLDINLPRLNGLEFIKTLQGKYHIILTTAYHEYALDGFNLNAVDYLLKPIEFSRFLQAINKVYALLQEPQVSLTGSPVHRTHFFFLQDKKNVKVFADEIRYIESLKDYIRIHTLHGPVVTKYQIGEMEELLSSGNFCRIHKSFIVNLDFVKAYSATDVEVGEESLPLGRTYVDLFRMRVRG